MSPRPLHRWKSFWLGVLVLIFLGWAWVRSIHHVDHLSYQLPASIAGLGANGRGALTLGRSNYPFGSDGLEFGHFQTAESDINWFPNAVTLTLSSETLWQTITIAYWFILLLFLVPWAGFLCWRVRRMRRAGEIPRSVESS